MALMIGCIWHGLDALQGTRAKPGNHLVIYMLNDKKTWEVFVSKTMKSPVLPTLQFEGIKGKQI